MHPTITFFYHYTGIDTQASPFYDFWSGIGPVIFGQLPILVSLLIYFRHRNCFVQGCWRLGHNDPEHHHPACRKHHSHRDALEAAKQRHSGHASS